MFLPANLPWAIPLTLLFLIGVLVGGQLNRAIYRLAWCKRPIGPWSAPHPHAPQRHWHDKLPVLGWISLRRESAVHGIRYWIRPLLIELSCGLGFASLYWWEITGHLLPSVRGTLIQPGTGTVHAQFLSHLILVSLMVVATFIDIDEKTIPDEITVPGLLLGLVLAALLPSSFLSVAASQGTRQMTPILITTPNAWLSWFDGKMGLAVGMSCFLAWIYAILPKTWWTRRGWRKACAFLVASIARNATTPRLLMLLVMGWIGIAGVWMWGGLHWQVLMTALVGISFSGGLIWAVRFVSGTALGREAMGFGDVTLMAMIGAFVGWQASLIVFFLAPFSGLAIAVLQWLLTRRKDIAYGPFLCVSTLLLLLLWPGIWTRFGYIFSIGWFVPALVAVCLVLMAILLLAWSLLTRAFLQRSEPTSHDQTS